MLGGCCSCTEERPIQVPSDIRDLELQLQMKETEALPSLRDRVPEALCLLGTQAMFLTSPRFFVLLLACGPQSW